jgi:hypothetical protein
MSNPTGYLTQYPPPGLATGPGTSPLQFSGLTGTFDVMPTDVLTLRVEVSYHRSNVGYFAGPNGITSPDGFRPTPTDFVPETRRDQTLLVVAAYVRL